MTNIKVEKNNKVLLIGIDRPDKKNAFDVDMYSDLGDAYGMLDSDNELNCGVLYAKGDHVTTGLDLEKWAPLFTKGEFPEIRENGIDPLGLDLDKRCKKPVVMALQGMCYTIGIELMLATDIRVASDNTVLHQIEIKRGIYPVGGATVRFAQEIGWGNAMRYLLTGDGIPANEAYRMGLFQEVTNPGEQFSKAFEIAEKIAKQAPLGVQATLRSARLTRYNAEKEAIKRLMPELVPIMQSEDFKEGIQSFIERREAQFKGY